MQLQAFMAITYSPLFALANPGADYVESVTTLLPPVQSEAGGPQLSLRQPTQAPENFDKVPSGGFVSKYTQNGAGQPGGAVQALARLRTFEAWGADWDGEGAPAPSSAALKSATLMLGFLTSKLGYTPTVALNGDGEPAFTIVHPDFELCVTIVSDTEVAFLVASGENERGGLADFDGRALPAAISAALAEIRPALV